MTDQTNPLDLEDRSHSLRVLQAGSWLAFVVATLIACWVVVVITAGFNMMGWLPTKSRDTVPVLLILAAAPATLVAAILLSRRARTGGVAFGALVVVSGVASAVVNGVLALPTLIAAVALGILALAWRELS